MKKMITIAAVSLLVVALSAGMAFADTPARGNANGMQLRNMNYSVEELLQVKEDRIDELVKLGRLTQEQATAFKATIAERMENCDGTGASSQEHARLAIGFGRTTAQGTNQGNGYRYAR
jgi:polyhydroxyalkanoate synthesis regulator phasin